MFVHLSKKYGILFFFAKNFAFFKLFEHNATILHLLFFLNAGKWHVAPNSKPIIPTFNFFI